MDWDEGPEVGGPHGPYLPVAAHRALPGGRRRAHRLRAASIATIAPNRSATAERTAAEKRQTCLPVPPRSPVAAERVAQFEAEGRPYALRFEVPLGRTWSLTT